LVMRKESQTRAPLLEALTDYLEDGVVRFHMPGHKGGRNLDPQVARLVGEQAFALDITGVEGMDDLHQPQGVLARAQELLAEAFGADYSYFLINGTSCGIQALLLTLCNPGDKIIVPRNMHKSMIAGVIFSGAHPLFVAPEITAAAAGSTGDGILMAEKVGAALYEEPWIIGLGVGTKVKGTDSLMMDWTKLYVNGEGKRFASEQMHYAIATNKIIEEGDVWIVMDSAEANADLIAAMEEAMPTDEVAKGDTLEELAEAMGVPVENFVATIEEYNQGAKTGKDAMGKDPEFVLPVEKAPFYAIKAHPKTMGTFGGVKTDEFYRVLRADGSVINNLYAGGECANKVLYNQVYMSGSAVQFALTSGRIAGEHAAKNLNN
jgi:hypothetical protein